MNNIAVVYTLWENLKKTSDMEVGQVGFHINKEVIIYFYVIISHTLPFNLSLFLPISVNKPHLCQAHASPPPLNGLQRAFTV